MWARGREAWRQGGVEAERRGGRKAGAKVYRGH